jgi:flagella basal body P-ring formation protein FlgA
MPTGLNKNVSKLTADTGPRPHFDGNPTIVAILVFVLLAASGMASATTAEWQAPGSITATAESYLKKRIGSDANRTTVQAGQLDPRHRLARCSQPLSAFLRRGTKISARTVVGVRCDGVKPWKVYVPVDVVVTDKVLVARRTLPRGHVVSADDLKVEQRDVSRLVSGYVSDIGQLVGQRLKTPLMAGRILTPQMLKADLAIRRGQSVTLVVASGGLSIRMAGTALMDGALNQRIRVENTTSGRVVEGIVRSREHVEILLPTNTHSIHRTPKVSPKLADTGSTNNDR